MIGNVPNFPQRLVCLTDETTDMLYRLGVGNRVVGVSGYTSRPADARRKPKVSAFVTAKFDRIEALQPDLVLAFSDLQADITAELVRRGLQVMTFNQRSVEEILQTLLLVGGLVGVPDRARHDCGNLQQGLQALQLAAARFPRRPRVFFEEWPDPLMSGIRWVEELVEIAGGEPIFPESKVASLARRRIVSPDLVPERAPDVIIASWCGKRVRKDRIAQRAGWQDIPAVRNGHIYEIRSSYILQPGPTALTEGARQIHAILCRATGVPLEPVFAPDETWDQH
jgi:iron complex transport system substrate-binding protein